MGDVAAEVEARFVTHPVFRRAAFGVNHPLSIRRDAALIDFCRTLGWLPSHLMIEPSLPRRDVLERFHTPEYLDAFENAVAAGVATSTTRARWNLGTMECPLFEGVWERANACVGGSILSAEIALSGRVAFHPSGGTHHGRPDRASGFCYLNDPVFAMSRLLDAGLDRVLYLDLDAHHGDGVEAAFAADERVTLASIHEEGRWPGTGTIAAHVHPRILNVPVPAETNDTEFLFAFREMCDRRLRHLEPEAVVVVCGADALAGDPLSSMRLSNGALWTATEEAISLARCALVLGGGGYNPWTTTRLWAGLWAKILGFPIPSLVPPAAQAILMSLDCDLVDDEDHDAAWTTTIEDQPKCGPIRSCVRQIVEAALPPGVAN